MKLHFNKKFIYVALIFIFLFQILDIALGTFKEKTDYIAMRANESIIKIISPTGVCLHGTISNEIKDILKKKENIEIKTYKNDLIYILTEEEYECMSGCTITKLKKKNIIP